MTWLEEQLKNLSGEINDDAPSREANNIRKSEESWLLINEAKDNLIKKLGRRYLYAELTEEVIRLTKIKEKRG